MIWVFFYHWYFIEYHANTKSNIVDLKYFKYFQSSNKMAIMAIMKCSNLHILIFIAFSNNKNKKQVMHFTRKQTVKQTHTYTCVATIVQSAHLFLIALKGIAIPSSAIPK